MPSPRPTHRPPNRRAADRQAALRDRSVVNRRIVLGAFGIGALIVLGFYWNRAGGDPVRDGAPGWSPDGTQIVFSSEQPDGQADLFVMGADGTRPRRVLETPDDEGHPAFSPDGRQIAFDTDRDGNSEIYVINVEGDDLRRVTNDPGRDLAPAWSPDGAWLAFISDRARPDLDVFRVRVDGTGLERLTQSGSNGFPQFSPVDPPRLAFHTWRDVHVLGLTSGLLSRLTTEPLDGMYPSWSPDGSQIAFMSARSGSTEIFTMNADGSEQQRLVSMPSGSAIDPRWSPTGRHIVFVHVPEETADLDQRAGRERAIYVVEIATGKLTRLSR
jgi:Tol biopolymer transport system component